MARLPEATTTSDRKYYISFLREKLLTLSNGESVYYTWQIGDNVTLTNDQGELVGIGAMTEFDVSDEPIHKRGFDLFFTDGMKLPEKDKKTIKGLMKILSDLEYNCVTTIRNKMASILRDIQERELDTNPDMIRLSRNTIHEFTKSLAMWAMVKAVLSTCEGSMSGLNRLMAGENGTLWPLAVLVASECVRRVWD